MKKLVRKMFLVALSVMMFCALFGCSNLFNSEKSTSKPKETVKIQIYNESIATEATATIGENVKIEPASRVGYYFKGYYDSNDGGTKYFNVLGVSVSPWQKNYPTKFYAQWGSIYELHFKSENSLITPYRCDFARLDTVIKFYHDLPLEITEAAKNNNDADIQVNLKFSAYYYTPPAYSQYIWLDYYITDLETNGRNTEITKVTVPNSYIDFSLTKTIKASFIKGGKLFTYLHRNSETPWGYCQDVYCRDMIVEMSFIK